MPYLRLRDTRSGETLEFEQSDIRIGRNPDSEFVVTGEGSHVVSGTHARLFHAGGTWQIEDLGSRNGTFVRNRRLVPGAKEVLSQGVEIRFGEAGPRFAVLAVAKRVVAETVVEGPAAVRPSAPTLPMTGLDDVAASPAAPSIPPTEEAAPPGREEPPSEPVHPALRVVMTEARTNDRFVGEGEQVRIGRGSDCELRPVAAGDTSVSRVHATVTLRDDGVPVLRDAGSRNGTIVNGRMLVSDHELRKGDRVQLGDAGPELVVQEVVARGVSVAESAGPDRESALVGAAERKAAAKKEKEAPRRSFGGVGRTVFIREVVEETQRKGSKRLRWVIGAFAVVLIGGGAAMYWYFEQQRRSTVAQLEAQQARVLAEADSVRRAAEAEYSRLLGQLEQAQAASAPAVVVESLRAALELASERTASLEASLMRAQASLDQQLSVGDSLQRAQRQELERMRAELSRARTTQAPTGLLDSLRRAVAAAEQNARAIEDRLRAAKGVDLASISQANQAAVGLVTAYFPDGVGDASGFALSASGYFVTNRHAVSDGGRVADTVYVTMADHQQSERMRADVVRVAPSGGPDLALLKIRNYRGPYIQNIDWTGTHVRQGEPAALIGFPEGIALALDRTRTVRTSMSAGIFSKVVEDGVQFDGFTVGGSSGSPVFNASGEVVAVHRAGLRAGPGLSLAVPVKLLIPLMPPDLQAEIAR
ncbi:MAG: FHA domain-containing protein [Gemmatimonadales bacterium]